MQRRPDRLKWRFQNAWKRCGLILSICATLNRLAAAAILYTFIYLQVWEKHKRAVKSSKHDLLGTSYVFTMV